MHGERPGAASACALGAALKAPAASVAPSVQPVAPLPGRGARRCEGPSPPARRAVPRASCA
eukprot:6750467-Lingulodinium_polyedra.AAC.1